MPMQKGLEGRLVPLGEEPFEQRTVTLVVGCRDGQEFVEESERRAARIVRHGGTLSRGRLVRTRVLAAVGSGAGGVAGAAGGFVCGGAGGIAYAQAGGSVAAFCALTAANGVKPMTTTRANRRMTPPSMKR